MTRPSQREAWSFGDHRYIRAGEAQLGYARGGYRCLALRDAGGLYGEVVLLSELIYLAKALGNGVQIQPGDAPCPTALLSDPVPDDDRCRLGPGSAGRFE